MLWPKVGGGGMLIGLARRGGAGRADVFPRPSGLTQCIETLRVVTSSRMRTILVEKDGPKTPSPPTQRIPPAAQTPKVSTVVLSAIGSTWGHGHRNQDGSSYKRFDDPNTCHCRILRLPYSHFVQLQVFPTTIPRPCRIEQKNHRGEGHQPN